MANAIAAVVSLVIAASPVLSSTAMSRGTGIVSFCFWPIPAMAMNWEGHDDWMLSFAPAFTLEAFVPEARPLPSRDCPVTPEDRSAEPI